MRFSKLRIDLGLSGDEGDTWVFWRVVIWVRSWSFRRFKSSHSGTFFLNHAPLAPARDRIGPVALPSPPSC